jgi:hypothetical protein
MIKAHCVDWCLNSSQSQIKNSIGFEQINASKEYDMYKIQGLMKLDNFVNTIQV